MYDVLNVTAGKKQSTHCDVNRWIQLIWRLIFNLWVGGSSTSVMLLLYVSVRVQCVWVCGWFSVCVRVYVRVCVCKSVAPVGLYYVCVIVAPAYMLCVYVFRTIYHWVTVAVLTLQYESVKYSVTVQHMLMVVCSIAVRRLGPRCGSQQHRRPSSGTTVWWHWYPCVWVKVEAMFVVAGVCCARQ